MQRLAHEFQNCPPIPQTSACPTSQDIAACFSPDADPAKVAQIVEHCSGCPACAEDWRVARDLSRHLSEAQVFETQSSTSWLDSELNPRGAPHISNLYPLSRSQSAANDAPTHPWWRRSKVRMGAGLCAVACAMGLLVLRSEPRPDSAEVLRGDITPSQPLASFRFEQGSFVWPDFEPGAEYQISLFDASGDRILDLDHTQGTSLRLPVGILAKLKAREKPVYWQVRTLHGTGRVSPVMLLEKIP